MINRPTIPQSIFTLLIFGFFSLSCSAPNTEPLVSLRTGVSADSGFRKQITVEEAEKANMVSDSRLGKDPISFGFFHSEWLAFIDKMQPGDVLIQFYTPPPFEDAIHGYAGFEIVRGGKAIDTFFTQM